MKERKYLEDNEKVISVLNEYKERNEYKINITIEGKPESYARERMTSRGNHFYNPKGKQMREFKKEAIHKLSKEEYEFTRKLILQESSDYTLDIEANFYIPIPQSDNQKTVILKEYKKIVPGKRPDTDNYVKFMMDALHDVFYSDDCVVTKITASKFYSVTPRTEIFVKYRY